MTGVTSEITEATNCGLEDETSIEGFIVREVTLHRKPGESLGISIVPSVGITRHLYQIKRLLPGSTCATAICELSVGDRLLQCNDCALRGLTQAECLDALKSAGPIVTLKVLHQVREQEIQELSEQQQQLSEELGDERNISLTSCHASSANFPLIISSCSNSVPEESVVTAQVKLVTESTFQTSVNGIDVQRDVKTIESNTQSVWEDKIQTHLSDDTTVISYQSKDTCIVDSFSFQSEVDILDRDRPILIEDPIEADGILTTRTMSNPFLDPDFMSGTNIDDDCQKPERSSPALSKTNPFYEDLLKSNFDESKGTNDSFASADLFDFFSSLPTGSSAYQNSDHEQNLSLSMPMGGDNGLVHVETVTSSESKWSGNPFSDIPDSGVTPLVHVTNYDDLLNLDLSSDGKESWLEPSLQTAETSGQVKSVDVFNLLSDVDVVGSESKQAESPSFENVANIKQDEILQLGEITSLFFSSENLLDNVTCVSVPGVKSEAKDLHVTDIIVNTTPNSNLTVVNITSPKPSGTNERDTTDSSMGVVSLKVDTHDPPPSNTACIHFDNSISSTELDASINDTAKLQEFQEELDQQHEPVIKPSTSQGNDLTAMPKTLGKTSLEQAQSDVSDLDRNIQDVNDQDRVLYDKVTHSVPESEIMQTDDVQKEADVATSTGKPPNDGFEDKSDSFNLKTAVAVVIASEPRTDLPANAVFLTTLGITSVSGSAQHEEDITPMSLHVDHRGNKFCVPQPPKTLRKEPVLRKLDNSAKQEIANILFGMTLSPSAVVEPSTNKTPSVEEEPIVPTKLTRDQADLASAALFKWLHKETEQKHQMQNLVTSVMIKKGSQEHATRGESEVEKGVSETVVKVSHQIVTSSPTPTISRHPEIPSSHNSSSTETSSSPLATIQPSEAASSLSTHFQPPETASSSLTSSGLNKTFLKSSAPTKEVKQKQGFEERLSMDKSRTQVSTVSISNASPQIKPKVEIVTSKPKPVPVQRNINPPIKFGSSITPQSPRSMASSSLLKTSRLSTSMINLSSYAKVSKTDYAKSRTDKAPFLVEVLKGIVGLGIKVKVTADGHVQVTEIQKNSPVDKNGNMKTGDYVLCINTTELTGLTEGRVQQVLRLLPRGLVKLVVSTQPPSSTEDNAESRAPASPIQRVGPTLGAKLSSRPVSAVFSSDLQPSLASPTYSARPLSAFVNPSISESLHITTEEPSHQVTANTSASTLLTTVKSSVTGPLHVSNDEQSSVVTSRTSSTSSPAAVISPISGPPQEQSSRVTSSISSSPLLAPSRSSVTGFPSEQTSLVTSHTSSPPLSAPSRSSVTEPLYVSVDEQSSSTSVKSIEPLHILIDAEEDQDMLGTSGSPRLSKALSPRLHAQQSNAEAPKPAPRHRINVSSSHISSDDRSELDTSEGSHRIVDHKQIDSVTAAARKPSGLKNNLPAVERATEAAPAESVLHVEDILAAARHPSGLDSPRDELPVFADRSKKMPSSAVKEKDDLLDGQQNIFNFDGDVDKNVIEHTESVTRYSSSSPALSPRNALPLSSHVGAVSAAESISFPQAKIPPPVAPKPRHMSSESSDKPIFPDQFDDKKSLIPIISSPTLHYFQDADIAAEEKQTLQSASSAARMFENKALAERKPVSSFTYLQPARSSVSTVARSFNRNPDSEPVHQPLTVRKVSVSGTFNSENARPINGALLPPRERPRSISTPLVSVLTRPSSLSPIRGSPPSPKPREVKRQSESELTTESGTEERPLRINSALTPRLGVSAYNSSTRSLRSPTFKENSNEGRPLPPPPLTIGKDDDAVTLRPKSDRFVYSPNSRISVHGSLQGTVSPSSPFANTNVRQFYYEMQSLRPPSSPLLHQSQTFGSSPSLDSVSNSDLLQTDMKPFEPLALEKQLDTNEGHSVVSNNELPDVLKAKHIYTGTPNTRYSEDVQELQTSEQSQNKDGPSMFVGKNETRISDETESQNSVLKTGSSMKADIISVSLYEPQSKHVRTVNDIGEVQASNRHEKTADVENSQYRHAANYILSTEHKLQPDQNSITQTCKKQEHTETQSLEKQNETRVYNSFEQPVKYQYIEKETLKTVSEIAQRQPSAQPSAENDTDTESIDEDEDHDILFNRLKHEDYHDSGPALSSEIIQQHASSIVESIIAKALTDFANTAAKSQEVANTATRTQEVANTATKPQEDAFTAAKIQDANTAVQTREEFSSSPPLLPDDEPPPLPGAPPPPLPGVPPPQFTMKIDDFVDAFPSESFNKTEEIVQIASHSDQSLLRKKNDAVESSLMSTTSRTLPSHPARPLDIQLELDQTVSIDSHRDESTALQEALTTDSCPALPKNENTEHTDLLESQNQIPQLADTVSLDSGVLDEELSEDGTRYSQDDSPTSHIDSSAFESMITPEDEIVSSSLSTGPQSLSLPMDSKVTAWNDNKDLYQVEGKTEVSVTENSVTKKSPIPSPRARNSPKSNVTVTSEMHETLNSSTANTSLAAYDSVTSQTSENKQELFDSHISDPQDYNSPKCSMLPQEAKGVVPPGGISTIGEVSFVLNNQLKNGLMQNERDELVSDDSRVINSTELVAATQHFVSGNGENETVIKNALEPTSVKDVTDNISSNETTTGESVQEESAEIKSSRKWIILDQSGSLFVNGESTAPVTVEASTLRHVSSLSPKSFAAMINDANKELDEAKLSKTIELKIVAARGLDGSVIKLDVMQREDYLVQVIQVGSRNSAVKEGDLILSVEGNSMKNRRPKQVYTHLENTGPKGTLVVASGVKLKEVVSSISSAIANSTPTMQMAEKLVPLTATHQNTTAGEPPSGPGTFDVIMLKGATGVGFCLEGGKGSPKGDLPIVIKRIFKGGPAEKTGQLKIGDEILSVDGVDFTKMRHYEAWNHLKFLNDGEIHIKIRRH